jgi:DNA-binding PadR family transcriptional regulator
MQLRPATFARYSAASAEVTIDRVHRAAMLTSQTIKTTVWLMSSPIGEFEQRILFALIRLGRGVHGVAIRNHLEERAGRPVSPGALYTALDRLEKRGFVTSRLGEPTPERGGKRKRLYRLQPAGERAVARLYESMRLMTEGMSARLRTLKG